MLSESDAVVLSISKYDDKRCALFWISVSADMVLNKPNIAATAATSIGHQGWTGVNVRSDSDDKEITSDVLSKVILCVL